MAGIKEKVGATQFSVPTALDFAAVTVAARAAAQHARKAITAATLERTVPGSLLEFTVRRLGAVTVMVMVVGVHYEPSTAGGGATVRLEVGDYLTSRPTLVMIPVGPADAPGYPFVRDFAAALKDSL